MSVSQTFEDFFHYTAIIKKHIIKFSFGIDIYMRRNIVKG